MESVIVKFCVLASGSSGNCSLVSTDCTRILIDAGLSFRELSKRLASIGEQPDRIDAVLVTHEHCDHISGLARLAKKVAAPIYLTHFTAPQIDWDNATPRSAFRPARLSIGDTRAEQCTGPQRLHEYRALYIRGLSASPHRYPEFPAERYERGGAPC